MTINFMFFKTIFCILKSSVAVYYYFLSKSKSTDLTVGLVFVTSVDVFN